MKTPGSVMLFCLIMMGVLLLLASLGFKTAAMLSMSTKMYSSYHQKKNLVEGLLNYGIHLCDHNQDVITCSLCKDGQSWFFTFDPWPSKDTVKMCGNYTGQVSMVGLKDSVVINAHLKQANRVILSGRCVVYISMQHPKNSLSVYSWSIGHNLC